MKKQTSNFSNTSFEEFTESLANSHPEIKTILIKDWISQTKKPVSLKNLQTLISDLVSKNDQIMRDQIIHSYVQKFKDDIPFEDILFLTNVVNNFAIRNAIIEEWFSNKTTSPSAKYDYLQLAIEKKLIDVQNPDRIAKISNIIGLSVVQIIDLGRKLYKNDEVSKIALFSKYLAKKSSRIVNQDREVIRDFLKDIKDVDLALKTIEENKLYLILSKKDILDICASKIDLRYSNIEDLLRSDLEKSLTADGIKEIKSLFGITDLSPHQLGNLISYFNVTHDVSKLLTIIKPDVLKAIRADYKISGDRPFLTSQEHHNLSILLGDKTPEFPMMRALCDYLGNVDERIPSPVLYDQSNVGSYTIFFSEASANDGPEKSRINREFKELLLDPYPPTDLVIHCLKDILEIKFESGFEINKEEQQKLRDFFEKNKEKLAVIFGKENGVDEFRALLPCLKDGCASNIANQFDSAYKRFTIKDPADRMLYLFFLREIRDPLFSTGVVDNLGSVAEPANPFAKTGVIAQSFLVPESLSQGLKKEMNSEAGNQMAWQIIGAEFTKSYGIIIKEDLLKAKNELGTHLKWNVEETAELASYLVLKSFTIENPKIGFFDSEKIEKFDSLMETFASRVRPSSVSTNPNLDSPVSKLNSNQASLITNDI